MSIKSLDDLNILPYFTMASLKQVGLNARKNSLYFNTKKWCEKGDLIRLKNGVYTTRDYLLKNDSVAYREFIANILKQPSYLSSWYVLNKYNAITESAINISSVTSQGTAVYDNKLGYFVYNNTNKRLYTGFYQEKIGPYTIFIATKAKALFDYLWFKSGNLDPRDSNLIEELRVNWEVFTEKDFDEFKGYCELANTKMTKIYRRIKKYV